MNFYNRSKELEHLNRALERERSLTIIYGKRRVGKTFLLRRFLSEKGGFFFTFSDSSRETQMEEFRDRAAEFLGDDLIRSIKGDWFLILRFLFRNLEEGSLVVLDEFTYAIRSDRKVLSDLQRLWDDDLQERSLHIILCGSLLGMVKDEILSHTSPLYGRRTHELPLAPFGYRDSLNFFSSQDYGILAYLLVGGMPEFLRVATDHSSLEGLVDREFLNPRGYFYREPYYLLSQNLREVKTYFSILNAIAYGKTRPTEISHFVGIETRGIYPYMETLQRLEFVRRETPVGGNRKRGVYKLRDPLFHSWFNLVYPRREEVEMEAAFFRAKETQTFLGRRFEELAREFLMDMNRDQKLGFSEIGSWWHKEEEIDIVCLDAQGKRVLLLEAKYHKLELSEARSLLSKLEQKLSKTPWEAEDWEVQLGVLGQGLTGKEELREEGFVCHDMGDILEF